MHVACALRAPPHVSKRSQTRRVAFRGDLSERPVLASAAGKVLWQCGVLMLMLLALRTCSAAPSRASNAPIRDIPYLTASKPRRNLRIGAIYRRFWNLTLSGGIVLSSNVSLAAMHPYLCVHFRVGHSKRQTVRYMTFPVKFTVSQLR